MDPETPEFVIRGQRKSPTKDLKEFEELKKSCVTFKGLKTFNGIPIVIVTNGEDLIIPKSFSAGLYGLDTESDYRNNKLRLIQIYDGKTVYIFSAESLNPDPDCPLTKFMTSKDRIKIGVDIDGDLTKMRNFIDRKSRDLKKINPNFKGYKLNTNGFLDLQSIARTMGEKGISLEKLADKYVEEFQGNPTLLSTYLNPTVEDYIYAANDAVLSYEIYKPLIERRITRRWQTRKENEVIDETKEKQHFTNWIEPQLERTRNIESLINFAVNSYKWNDSMDNETRIKKAREYINSMDLDSDSSSSEELNKQISMQLTSLTVNNAYKDLILQKIKQRLTQKLHEEEVKIIKLIFAKDLYYDLLHKELIKNFKYRIKDRSWFVKTFSDNCSNWKRRFESNVILRQRLAELFFDVALFKDDIVCAGDDLYQLRAN